MNRQDSSPEDEPSADAQDTEPADKTHTMFDPDHVYYSGEKNCYLVDVGEIYRTYSRKTPVKNGIKRFLEAKGDEANDDLLSSYMEDIELDRAVD